MKKGSFCYNVVTMFFPAICVLFLASCQGGLCSATMSSLEDADSDCVADSSDNCADIYNPVQFDGDADGVGFECDSDDGDETVAMGLIRDPGEVLEESLTDETLKAAFSLSPTYTLPTEVIITTQELDFSTEEDGYYFLVSCDGNFLGKISFDNQDLLSLSNEESDYALLTSEISILNSQGVYGRAFTSCSAFNDFAQYPPQIYYRSLVDLEDLFVGYLTTNETLNYGYDTCWVLDQIFVNTTSCE